MAATFNEIIDILDKWQFFLGRRAGRELWVDKPTKIQEEDLTNFNRDLETVRSFVNLLRTNLHLGDLPTCDSCEYLNVINNNEIYGVCEKTGVIFKPFELDTRAHYCTCFRRKEKNYDNKN